MSSYTAPLSDLRFALHDVLKVEPLFARLGFTDATADVVDAVLEEAGRFSATVLALSFRRARVMPSLRRPGAWSR